MMTQGDFGASEFVLALVSFVITFLGSLFIGIVVGWCGSLLFRYTDMSVRGLSQCKLRRLSGVMMRSLCVSLSVSVSPA